jgi:hypothetical protein
MMFLGCLYIQKVILYEVVMEKILEKELGMVQGLELVKIKIRRLEKFRESEFKELSSLMEIKNFYKAGQGSDL